MDELADAMDRNRATAFRWQQLFREAYPEFDSPRDLLDAAGVGEHTVLSARGVRGLQVARS
jgi:hypothetical protein